MTGFIRSHKPDFFHIQFMEAVYYSDSDIIFIILLLPPLSWQYGLQKLFFPNHLRCVHKT